jgi:hypothetical protein
MTSDPFSNEGDFPDLSSLPPEQRQALLALSTEGQRGAVLERQLAQAQALRGHSMAGEHTSAIGAALGGLADILNAGRANNSEQEALRRQQELIQGHEAGLTARMSAGIAPRSPWPGGLSQPPLVSADADSQAGILPALLRRRSPEEMTVPAALSNPFDFG